METSFRIHSANQLLQIEGFEVLSISIWWSPSTNLKSTKNTKARYPSGILSANSLYP